MIRVKFDHDYIDGLDDYYHRNECIREQQYLSPEKLLHLAAFYVSKAATGVNENSESRRNGPNAEAALNVNTTAHNSHLLTTEDTCPSLFIFSPPVGST